jgi:L-cysteine/cystine lyase
MNDYRQNFPALSNKAYFNYGGQGPLPQSAWAAIQKAYEHVQQMGPFSNAAGEWVAAQVASTRRAIAADLGAAAGTIALTEAVSVGSNIALWGIDWQPGDQLLISDCEHYGIVAAAEQIGRRFGVELSILPLLNNPSDPVAVLAQHLRPQTRMLVISHILWNTGQVLPLAEMVKLCHSQPRPVAVLVDAAQSVGLLPLNLEALEADFYAFTGHKWYCGPDGLGGLYIHPPALEALQPSFVGWRSIVNDPANNQIAWKPDGRRFEIATSAFPLCGGLQAALALHASWGSVEERYQRICDLGGYLWQKLVDLPGVVCLLETAPEAGLVAFQTPGRSHQQLVQDLEQQHIMVRSIPSPDCVRACVHYFTLESECDRLVDAIATYLKARS